MWELRETKEFERKFEKLPPDIKKRFENQIRKLQENPYALGRPLRYPWLRELKNDKFRVYYLIYNQLVVVLFVGVSDKKSQQVVINAIKSNLKTFKEFVEKGATIIKEERL
ncbi:MAG: type II toxin-antitoxin system RelE/ParE family toxin [Parcubacteria group bacterium]|nr:type II toxin-antitoxin system RelE/ParE family toxin [Parcubacteria group bacterium]